jgi:hypothetical protein
MRASILQDSYFRFDYFVLFVYDFISPAKLKFNKINKSALQFLKLLCFDDLMALEPSDTSMKGCFCSSDSRFPGHLGFDFVFNEMTVSDCISSVSRGSFTEDCSPLSPLSL